MYLRGREMILGGRGGYLSPEHGLFPIGAGDGNRILMELTRRVVVLGKSTRRRFLREMSV